jgi:DNA-binding SARP family transcriptional activator
VETSSSQLRLTPELAVDLRDAVATARRLLDPSSDATDVDVSGLPFYADILPDWYDDWVAMDRERFRELRVHALEAASASLASIGRYGDAMEVALAAVRGEPLRESAHRAVIRVHMAEGNRAQALAEYRRFRNRLWCDLGLSPSPRMDELIGDLQVR